MFETPFQIAQRLEAVAFVFGDPALGDLVQRHRIEEMQPEKREEGYSRMTYELEPKGETVKLTVLHEMDRGQSKFIEAVSNGWPTILSSLKSLLETGESLEETRTW